MRSLFLLLVLVLSGCTTLDERVSQEPSNNFITNKSAEEYKNCLLQSWAMLNQVTEVRKPNGYRILNGHMGFAGAVADIMEDAGQTRVVTYIPSSSWAVIPRKMKQSAENCK